jgi:hypothetical protein
MKNEYWNRERQRDKGEKQKLQPGDRETTSKKREHTANTIKRKREKAAMVKNTNGIHKIHKIYKF